MPCGTGVFLLEVTFRLGLMVSLWEDNCQLCGSPGDGEAQGAGCGEAAGEQRVCTQVTSVRLSWV